MSLALLGPAWATSSGAPRREAVDTIIVHAISGPTCAGGRLVFSGAPGDAERWKAFFDRHPFLGIHHVVDREGVAFASTPEDRVANHALDATRTEIVGSALGSRAELIGAVRLAIVNRPSSHRIVTRGFAPGA